MWKHLRKGATAPRREEVCRGSRPPGSTLEVLVRARVDQSLVQRRELARTGVVDRGLGHRGLAVLILGRIEGRVGLPLQVGLCLQQMPQGRLRVCAAPVDVTARVNRNREIVTVSHGVGSPETIVTPHGNCYRTQFGTAASAPG